MRLELVAGSGDRGQNLEPPANLQCGLCLDAQGRHRQAAPHGQALEWRGERLHIASWWGHGTRYSARLQHRHRCSQKHFKIACQRCCEIVGCVLRLRILAFALLGSLSSMRWSSCGALWLSDNVGMDERRWVASRNFHPPGISSVDDLLICGFYWFLFFIFNQYKHISPWQSPTFSFRFVPKPRP